MPDISDVETALCGIIADALFELPLLTNAGALLTTETGQSLITDDGSAYQEGAFAATAAGTLVRVLRGWPYGTNLIRDLDSGRAWVTVFPDKNMARNTTRYTPQRMVLSPNGPLPPPTMSLTAANGVVVVNGTPQVGQVCGVLVGPEGSGIGYAYRVVVGDTASTVATALAALVPNASATGLVITMPTDLVVARVVQDVPTVREERRQEQMFRVSCWCPNPAVRDVLASAIDSAIAQYVQFVLASGWAIYIRGRGTTIDDKPSKSAVWVRDLHYAVEYPTNSQANLPSVLFPVVTVAGNTLTF